jgi:hypothetical protein
MSQELEKALEICKAEVAPAVLEAAKKIVKEVGLPYLKAQVEASENKFDDVAYAFAEKAILEALEQLKI